MVNCQFSMVNGSPLAIVCFLQKRFIRTSSGSKRHFVGILLGYENGRYIHVGHQYPELYAAEIQRYNEQLAEQKANNSFGCERIPFMLAYYFSGQEEEGWKMLETYIGEERIDSFRETSAEILADPDIFIIGYGSRKRP